MGRARQLSFKTLTVVGATAALASWPAAASARTRPRHRGARHGAMIRGDDNATLHMIRHSGSVIEEQGSVSGTVPGIAKVRLNVGATISGRLNFYPRGGEIIGVAAAQVRNGHGSWQSFSGSLRLTGGRGRYSHAHGKLAIYGAINRRTYVLKVHLRGSFTY